MAYWILLLLFKNHYLSPNLDNPFIIILMSSINLILSLTYRKMSKKKVKQYNGSLCTSLFFV